MPKAIHAPQVQFMAKPIHARKGNSSFYLWIDGKPSWIEALRLHDLKANAFMNWIAHLHPMPKAIHAPQVQFMAKPIHARKGNSLICVPKDTNLMIIPRHHTDEDFP